MKNPFRTFCSFASAFAASLFSLNSPAQPNSVSIPDGAVAPACNVGAASMLEANTRAYSRSVSMYTPQGSMSPASIYTCGKFRLYYEDINQGVASGFNDPLLGNSRRLTLCAVLTYVDSVIDINVNGTTDFIDLYIERSVDAFNPADPSDTYLGQASPYFGPGFGSTPGIYNGNVYDHMTSGVDPDPAQYDGCIKVNFHQVYNPSTGFYQLAQYWNYYLNTTDPCVFDLYSILLHEVTHAMGFGSCISEDPVTHDAVGGPSFTLFDSLFLHYKDNLNNFHKVLLPGPIINPAVNGYTDPLRSNRIWLNDDLPPTNQPIYSGSLAPFNFPPVVSSFMSHMNGAVLSFTGMAQESPGYQPNYVMGPGFSKGQLKRRWTLAEIRILLAMGYALNPTFAAANWLNGTDNNAWLLTGNTAGYRTNSYTQQMTSYNNPYNFMDLLPADHAMTNNNTPASPSFSSWTFSVGSLANVADPNGDQLRVMPGTLFAIRGVSDGANNHACVTTNPNGDIIKYVPVPGFHGRAQFGFYLWDGHERGALRVVTIDVSPGTAYTLTPGDEMVLFGDYEDGTELRQRILNPAFENTQWQDNTYEGVYAGTNFSGGHPFNYVTNWWTIGGGDIVEETYATCSMSSHPPRNYFGSHPADWKTPALTGISHPEPPPGPGTNQRYHTFSGPYNYSTLINPVSACNVYRFECDINFEKTSYTVGQTVQFQLQFVSNPFPGYHTDLYYTAPVQVTVSTVAPDTWQHVVFDFQYCGTATYYMNLLLEGIVTPQLVVTGTGDTGTPLTNVFWPSDPLPLERPYLDNISLKQITPTPAPVTLNVTADPTGTCAGSTVDLLALPTPYLPCNATYSWQPGSLAGHAVTTGPLSSTTTFTATVSYACGQSANATTTVTVVPPGTLSITPLQPMCEWEAPVQLQAVPSGGVFSGTGVVLSGGNYYFDPALAGIGGPYTITYNYSGTCGTLNGSIQVTVQPGNILTWPKVTTASWVKSHTTGKGVVTDAAGNVYIVGSVINSIGITSTLTGGTPFTTNKTDIVVAKYSEQCGLMWQKIFGGAGDDEGNDIALDADGNLFITGSVSHSYTFAPGFNVAVPTTAKAAFVARLDPDDGTVTGFKHNTSLSTASAATGIGLAVSQNTGDVYMTGTYTQTITFSPLVALTLGAPGTVDVFVVRMNNALTSASWNTRIFSTGHDFAAAVALNSLDNLYVGCTVTGAGNAGGSVFNAAGATGLHAFIASYNSANTFQAGKIMGSNGNNATLNDLVSDAAGRLYFCGTFSGSITFFSTFTTTPSSDRQMYVTKLNPNLVFVASNWTKVTGNPASSGEDALGIAYAPTMNSVYFTGYAGNSAAFPGFTPSTMTGITASGEVFVAGILTSGTPTQLVHTTSTTTGTANKSFAVTVHSSGTQYNTGTISHATTFGTLGTFTPINGNLSLFVAREDPGGFFFRTEEAPVRDTATSDGNVVVYPNPSNGNVELLFNGNVPENVDVLVTDISGRIVSEGRYSPAAGTIALDLSMCENGTYIIIIRDEKKQVTKRVIIQK